MATRRVGKPPVQFTDGEKRGSPFSDEGSATEYLVEFGYPESSECTPIYPRSISTSCSCPSLDRGTRSYCGRRSSSRMPAAGRRTLGLSLWQPNSQCDWLANDDSEPRLTYLPSQLWLIGLGHLGQAYLWGLGLLPYASPRDLSLVLQDVDRITPSTESTSILTNATMVGVKKTRAMADWAERRGFKAAIHERLFDGNFKCRPDEPAVALCGLDNAAWTAGAR